VLAAKAIVIGSVSFVAGLIAAAAAVIIAAQVAHARGAYVYPVPWPTELRMVVGTAALIAVTAVLAVALGTLLRRSAVAVTVVIVVIVLPYILGAASVLPVGPRTGCCGSLRPPPSPSSRPRRSTSRSPPSTRPIPAFSR
jgi:hypothetical protein